MKKIFTLRSVVATLILCCSTFATAKTQATPLIDCGQTGASYMPEVAYVGQAVPAEFWIRGKHLQGDITFRGYSDKDTEAIFSFEPEVVTKAEAEAGTEISSKIFKMYITPKAVIEGAKYFLELITDGYTSEPIEVLFPPVIDVVPHFTFYVENPYGDEIYVGRQYESTLLVKGNEFVTDSVYLIIPEGSDIISITPNALHKDSVLTQWGAEVKVRFRPSKATEITKENPYARTTFPLIVRTSGMPDQICHEIACQVSAATPAITITAGMYGKDVYIGETIQKTIWVKGNPFLQGDITLSKVNAEDDMTFEPSIIKKADAQTADGAAVVVTITPKVSSNGEMAYFYFKASTAGAEDTEAYIRVWEVKAHIPEVTLQVPGYIANNGMVGKNFKISIQVIANQFTHSDITLYSDNEDVRLFSPSTISAAQAQVNGGAKVSVYIRPSKASETPYTNQSFVIKARTAGAAADAEATIQFAVDPNDGSGYDQDSDIITHLPSTTISCNIWSTPNNLVVELNETAHVQVYTLTGQCVVNTQTPAGIHTFALPQGMYIAQIHDSSTKVIVK